MPGVMTKNPPKVTAGGKLRGDLPWGHEVDASAVTHWHGGELHPDTDPEAIAQAQRQAIREFGLPPGVCPDAGAIGDAVVLPAGVVARRLREMGYECPDPPRRAKPPKPPEARPLDPAPPPPVGLRDRVLGLLAGRSLTVNEIAAELDAPRESVYWTLTLLRLRVSAAKRPGKQGHLYSAAIPVPGPKAKPETSLDRVKAALAGGRAMTVAEVAAALGCPRRHVDWVLIRNARLFRREPSGHRKSFRYKLRG